MRLVSLVPSATETLLALGVPPIACTRFCEQPGIPTVGGTKNPDVAAIVALHPDLVVVNNEENRREDANALSAAGLALHDLSPRSLGDIGPGVATLADALGVDTPVAFRAPHWDEWLTAPTSTAVPARHAVVFVWRRPWMALAADTYAASLLARLGVGLVAVGVPGVRYPSVTLDDVRAAAPDLVILPSEPYAFRARHVEDVERALPGVRVVRADGRDLFWWGTRTPAAADRLRIALS